MKTLTYMPSDNKRLESRVNQDLLIIQKKKLDTLPKPKQKELMASIAWLFIPDDMKKKKREELEKTMRTNDIIIMILAFIGIITNIIASTYYLESKRIKDAEGWINMQLIPHETMIVLIFRIITTFTTIILEIFLIRHYFIRMQFLVYKQMISITSSLYSTGLLWKMLIEMGICIIHSPPMLNNVCITFPSTTGENQPSYTVDVDLFLSSIIPIRVYLLLRYFSFYSSWADDVAQKVCNECNTLGGISFAIKAELKERPYTMVGILMIFSLLIFGYALRNVELGFMQYKAEDKFQDWSIVWNGFWCIMITIFTVGYGDFYPQTILGRVIVVVACLWGTFLISLMVVSLTITVEFTPQEQKAYEELKKSELQKDLKKKALLLIRSAVKLRRFPNNKEDIIPMIKEDYDLVINRLKFSLHEFRTSRKYILSQEQEMSPNNILYKLNENITEEMEMLIFSSNSQVTSLLEYLKLSEGIQNEIKSYVDKLDIMTEEIENCLNKNEEEMEDNQSREIDKTIVREINKGKNNEKEKLKEETTEGDTKEDNYNEGTKEYIQEEKRDSIIEENEESSLVKEYARNNCEEIHEKQESNPDNNINLIDNDDDVQDESKNSIYNSNQE